MMKLSPDPKLRTKFYLTLLIFGLISVVGFGLLGYLIGEDARPGSGSSGVTIVLILNALWLVPGVLLISPYFKSLKYEIHKDEVIVRAGVIERSVKHVPFRTVTNLKVVQGPLDRLFGLGTLNIQTAGMSGQTGAEEKLRGLVDFQGIYAHVSDALRQFRQPISPTQAGEDNLTTPMTDVLNELRAIRVLLEAKSD